LIGEISAKYREAGKHVKGGLQTMSELKVPTYKRFITGPLWRFDERNVGFSRLQRNEVPQTEKRSFSDGLYHPDPSRAARKGYGQKDYALTWSARTIDYLVRANLYSRDSKVAETKVDVTDKVLFTQKIKSVAHWFGADLVGICEVNPNWVYSYWGDYSAHYSGGLASPGNPIEIPSWLKYAVVIVTEEDYEEVKRSPAVEGATTLGYAQMAFIATSVATYIRELGYHAIPCGNDYSLSVPLAIDAGLGEFGRHGMLITRQFGPRVRVCKVFTNLPLKVDSPIDLGVQDFCERCQRCAEACPSRAIMFGERTDKAWDVSNNINVLKWPIKAMDCLNWWIKNRNACSNCIRVCPYNKPHGWLHSLVKKTVKTTPVFDRLFVKMDRALGYGKQVVK